MSRSRSSCLGSSSFSASAMEFPLAVKVDRLATHRAAARHPPDRPQRTARLQRCQVADELLGTVFPGALERKIPAGLARHPECADTRAPQIDIQRANRMIRNHI